MHKGDRSHSLDWRNGGLRLIIFIGLLALSTALLTLAFAGSGGPG